MFNIAYTVIAVTAGVLIALSLAMACWAFLRYNDLRIVSKKPSRATARLIKKQAKRQIALLAEITKIPMIFEIHYEFKDSRGKAYRGKNTVTREIFDTILPTSGIEIAYDYDRPTRNVIEVMLEPLKFKYMMLTFIGSMIVLLLPLLVL